MELKLGKRIGLLIECMFGTIILIALGQYTGKFMISIPNEILNNVRPDLINDVWTTVEEYVYFIGLWIVALLFMLCSKMSRPILQVIGTKPRGNTWKYFLIGILIGFGLNGICAFGAWLNHDIYLDYIGFRPVSFVIIFLCVLIQSSAEELLCRGFLYQKGMQYFKKPIVAILSNALLFAVLHLANNGVTIVSVINIFLSGTMFSLMVYYMDSLWCAFGAHAAWNFTQNILLGLPNSGIVVPYSVFKLDASTARDSFAYNVSFGVEGTILSDVVLFLACIAIFVWGRKHGKKPYDIWQVEQKETIE